MPISSLDRARRKRAWRTIRRSLGYYALRHLKWLGKDYLSNRSNGLAERRFLVVRHSLRPDHYQVLLDWIESRVPQLRPLFELRLLPCRVRDWSPYILHLPWVQDPVQNWSPTAYEQACRLAEKCHEKQIPVINRVERLANAGKSRGAELMASVGIRTPRHVRILDEDEFKESAFGLSFPIIVREDWGHGQPTLRVDTHRELKEIPLQRFSRPIAVEFIDVQSKHDGLYRKYRYVAAGDQGIPLHIHISGDWNTKGMRCEFSAALCEEELAYLDGVDANHERLQQARRALGLDFVAFDYGYDHEGQFVVWEANPYPYIHISQGRRRYRAPAVERTFAAMLKLYLDRADLPIPDRLGELLSSVDAKPRG